MGDGKNEKTGGGRRAEMIDTVRKRRSMWWEGRSAGAATTTPSLRPDQNGPDNQVQHSSNETRRETRQWIAGGTRAS